MPIIVLVPLYDKYIRFLLLVASMIYKGAVNTELANTEALILETMQG